MPEVLSLLMTVIERNPEGRAGFCEVCGETGLHPNSNVCDECSDKEPKEAKFIECHNSGCRNILGPVSVESNDKYCSNECASQNIH